MPCPASTLCKALKSCEGQIEAALTGRAPWCGIHKCVLWSMSIAQGPPLRRLNASSPGLLGPFVFV